jgi:predicted ATP-dependent serine protease
MGRVSKNPPRDQAASLTMEQRINVLLQNGMDNDSIMYALSRLRQNLAAIEDDEQREKLSIKFGIECPKFDKIFRQRLLEQIRKCKSQYKKDGDELDFYDSMREDDGSARRIQDIPIVDIPRFSLGIKSLDELLGQDPISKQWGLPWGCCCIVGAGKGTGKTRLAVEIASHVGSPNCLADAKGNKGVLYIQNEESPEIFRTRVARVWSDKHKILLSSSDNLIQHAALIDRYRPRLIVLDSLQDTRQARYAAGLRTMMSAYKALAQDLKCSFWMISHVNGEGNLKGGTYLGHKVDIELTAEKSLNTSEFTIKCGEKNRYGRTGKVAAFKHTETGVVELDPEKDRTFSMSNQRVMLQKSISSVESVRLGRLGGDLPVGGLPDGDSTEGDED